MEDYNEDAKIIIKDIDNPTAIRHWLYNQDCFTTDDGEVLPDGAIAGYLADNGATQEQIDLVIKIAHEEDPAF